MGLIRSENPVLTCPFDMHKSYYLFNYLHQHRLNKEVIVEPKKNQIKIPLLNPDHAQMVNEWHDHNANKIFQKYFGNQYLNYHAVILTINLFGKRKIESIGISTSTNREHLQTLAHSFSQTINQYVYIANKDINIPDIVTLCQRNVPLLTALDSAELVNYMSLEEKGMFSYNKVGSEV